MAIKATYVELNKVGRPIFKNPVTDSGTKKSAKGLLAVHNVNGKRVLQQDVDWDTVNDPKNELKLVYRDGKLLRSWRFSEVRQNAFKTLPVI